MYVLNQYDKKKCDAGQKSREQFPIVIFFGIIITCGF